MHKFNKNGLLLAGKASQLADRLSDYLIMGVYENKPTLFFNFEGEATVMNLDNGNFPINNLIDIVEEVLIDGYYSNILITREHVVPNTRVSIIFCNDNNQVFTYAPTIKDILIGIKYLCDSYGTLNYLGIIRDINHSLNSSEDISVLEILEKYKTSLEIDRERVKILSPVNKNNWFRTNLEVFFNIIKHIMISEDKNYFLPHNEGRYQIQLAIYDYIKHKMPLDDVLKKYKLPNNQYN